MIRQVSGICYRVVRRERKSVLIRLNQRGEVEVLAPASMGAAALDRLILRRQAWIRSRLAAQPPREIFLSQPTVPLWGRAVPWRACDGRRVAALTAPGEAAAQNPGAEPVDDGSVLLLPGDPARQQAALIGFYRDTARSAIDGLIARWAPRIGASPAGFAVKEQKTRWGSCSARGHLNFNWRLVLAPPAALEYVVVHELCHLVQLNHAPAFWALVAQQLPGYREQIAYLKAHGQELWAFQCQLPPKEAHP